MISGVHCRSSPSRFWRRLGKWGFGLNRRRERIWWRCDKEIKKSGVFL